MGRRGGAFIGDDRRVIESGEPLINYQEPKHGNLILTNKYPFRDDSGEIVGVIGVFFIIEHQTSL